MVKAATPLVRASALAGRRIVSEDGISTVEVQDLVLADDGHRIEGFTVREPGIFGKRHVATIPVSAVKTIGPDAVIIEAEHELTGGDHDPAVCADVKGRQVLTDDGTDLGTVADVVVETKRNSVQVVVLELDRDGERFLVLPRGTSVGGDAVVVPGAMADALVDTPEAAAEAISAR